MSKFILKPVAGLFLLAMFVGVTGSVAAAQEMLDIQSDNLKIDNKQNSADFTGNVRVTRAEVVLTADQVHVAYQTKEDAATGVQIAGDNDVREVVATGSVVIDDGVKNITSDKAIYDVPNDKMTLIGNVVVKEGTENTIVGTKMLYDMTQGLITMSSESGRVRATLMPESKK